MQLNIPRLCAQPLVTFAQAVADILDLVSVTIEDNSPGNSEFMAPGSGEYQPAKFVFEAADGAKVEVTATPGAPLGVKLAAKFVRDQLEAVRVKKRADSPPPATRSLERSEALRIIDRIRNEMSAMKSQLPVDVDLANDTAIRYRLLFNDGSEFQGTIPNQGPITGADIDRYVLEAKEQRARTGNGGAPGGSGDRGGEGTQSPDAQPQPKG